MVHGSIAMALCRRDNGSKRPHQHARMGCARLTKKNMTDAAVSNETIELTTRCKKAFVCLTDHHKGLCQVNYRSGQHVLHVNTLNSSGCNYCVRFGKANHFCTCPVRVELYDRFGF